ncbi:hypothetical protein L3Q82_004936 [Scortum barcoo]|uniref:Uncharacterized protein n=1 Tax=Scortum barcoo TaxID=214431 RepID=A0ACB8VGN4_9TELE|nr:hypothetical protein L3Q82_004936 [Scortum barcoo]
MRIPKNPTQLICAGLQEPGADAILDPLLSLALFFFRAFQTWCVVRSRLEQGGVDGGEGHRTECELEVIGSLCTDFSSSLFPDTKALLFSFKRALMSGVIQGLLLEKLPYSPVFQGLLGFFRPFLHSAGDSRLSVHKSLIQRHGGAQGCGRLGPGEEEGTPACLVNLIFLLASSPPRQSPLQHSGAAWLSAPAPSATRCEPRCPLRIDRTPRMGTTRLPAFSMDGDYIVGGVFSLHRYTLTVKHNYTTIPESLRIDARELRFSRAMVFAIEEINNSTELLPGIKLGYLIHDSCASVPVAVHVAFQLSNGLDPVFYTGDNCSQSGMVMAVVGEPLCHMSTAVVIVAFAASGDLMILLEELSREPSPPRQWIGSAETDQRVCDGTEDIKTLQNPYTDTSQLRITNMVYKAVYAIAHAIHNAVYQKTNSTNRIELQQVLNQLKKVNFSRNGYDVSFDANGDPVARYELVNWQKSESGRIELVTVGHYDASLPAGKEFRINKNLIWVDGGTQVPVSVCSDSCPLGTRKVLQKGKPICCYDCVPCPEAEISNFTDSPDCFPCPKEFWPNAERDTCFPKPVEFLSFGEVLGIILAVFSPEKNTKKHLMNKNQS